MTVTITEDDLRADYPVHERFEHNGYRVTIEAEPEIDENDNPRTFDGNVGVMVTPHRRYTLGDDRQERAGYAEALCAMEHLPAALFARWARIFLGATVVLPVAMIDHSGLSCWVGSGPSESDPGGWDSGQVGWIFDTPATRKESGVEPEHVEEALRVEVKCYDAYLQGSVVRFEVERKDTWRNERTGETTEGWEHVESCGGFLVVDGVEGGGIEYVREAARDAVPDEPA